MKTPETPTLLLDSNYLAHQARFCLKGLGFNNIHTGVIFGFLTRVLSLAQRFRTNDICFFWDSRKSIRKKRYPFYKKKRHQDLSPQEQEELWEAFEQFRVLRMELLPLIGFRNNFLATGHEADDILAKAVMSHMGKFIIITADEDMFQLLDYCDVYNPQKDSMMTRQALGMERGATPQEWVLMKQIAGCSSDNVPGIVGVGEKTALQYLHGTLTSRKKLEAIEKGVDIIERNKWLVMLPLPNTPDIIFRPDELSLESFMDICKDYGLSSFLEGERLREWRDMFEGNMQPRRERRTGSAKDIVKRRRRTR